MLRVFPGLSMAELKATSMRVSADVSEIVEELEPGKPHTDFGGSEAKSVRRVKGDKAGIDVVIYFDKAMHVPSSISRNDERTETEALVL